MAVTSITLGQVFCYLQEHAVAQFIADWPFAWYLEQLSQAPHPLLLHFDGRPVIRPNSQEAQAFWWTQTVDITDVGREVLNCRADHVRLNGEDLMTYRFLMTDQVLLKQLRSSLVAAKNYF